MKAILLAAASLLYVGTAIAQQPSCKSFYAVGEAVPAGCVKTFDRWGDGKAVAPSDKPRGSVLEEDTYFKTFYAPGAPRK